MAIRVNLSTTPVGIELPEAYVRVMDFAGNKDRLAINVGVFFSQSACLAGAKPLYVQQHIVPPAVGDGGVLPSIYEALKSLASYTGAEDC